VLKNPVLAQNNLSPRHEMGVGFHLFTHFPMAILQAFFSLRYEFVLSRD